MTNNQELLDQPNGNIDLFGKQPDADTVDEDTENGLEKIALGALIGATLGAIAGALAIKGTAQKVNQTVKNVGNTIKNTASGFNETVKTVGDTINTVANGVNNTTQDVGNTVRDTAMDVNKTVKNTVSAVTATAVNINDTVQNTANIVKSTTQGIYPVNKVNTAQSEVTGDVTPSDIQNIDLPNQMGLLIVPIDNQE